MYISGIWWTKQIDCLCMRNAKVNVLLAPSASVCVLVPCIAESTSHKYEREQLSTAKTLFDLYGKSIGSAPFYLTVISGKTLFLHTILIQLTPMPHIATRCQFSFKFACNMINSDEKYIIQSVCHAVEWSIYCFHYTIIRWREPVRRFRKLSESKLLRQPIPAKAKTKSVHILELTAAVMISGIDRTRRLSECLRSRRCLRRLRST